MLMEGELDPFDFMLAERLHMTVEEMRERLSNQEYIQWAAFFEYRAAMEKLEMDAAMAKARK